MKKAIGGKRKKFLVSFFFILFFLPAAVWADTAYQTLWWQHFSPNTYGDSQISIAAGGDDVFVAGMGSYDVIVAKFSAATGEKIWEVQWGTSRIDQPTGIAVDTTGNLYVLGSTSGVFPGPTEFFLVKLNGATGEKLWTKALGEAGGSRIAVDGEGNLLVTGGTLAALEAGKENAGSSDVFVAKLSGATGDQLWIKQFGSPQSDFPGGIAVDAQGNAYVTGSSFGSVEEGIANAGSTDIFLAKFSGATGNTIWLKQLGSPEGDNANAVAVDNSGNVFVAGATLGVLEEGGTNAGYADLFVAAFDAATGQAKWLRQQGSTVYDSANGVVVDGGKVFITGTTFGSLEAGKANAGGSDMFLAALNGASGDNLWMRQIGTQWGEEGYGIAALGGKLFVAGYTSDPLAGHIFLAKFGPQELSPLEQIDRIIGDFDAGVAAGTIAGSGPGNSASGRETALRNMLLALKSLIVSGDTAAACSKLVDVYPKLDEVAIPPDFISGGGVAAIAAEVVALKSSLGCSATPVARLVAP